MRRVLRQHEYWTIGRTVPQFFDDPSSLTVPYEGPGLHPVRVTFTPCSLRSSLIRKTFSG